jgi:hypothetical protein
VADTYRHGSYIVRKYSLAEFPSDGIAISDIVCIIVNNTGGANTVVSVTLDSKADIDAGDATWVEWYTVNTGTSNVFISDGPVPNGVRIVGGTGTVWVKS